MNQALLSRLFKAIDTEDTISLRKIASTIIADEKKKGHKVSATRLESLLSASMSGETEAKHFEVSNKMLVSLPRSPRDRRNLASLTAHSDLRHHMVLSPAVEEKFQRIEREFAATDRLKKYSLHPRRKILLYGPPGCGKSMGAERLAWNTGLPLLKVRFDSLISSYLGDSASNLREIFDAAHKQACVLLLDECDIIAKSRIGHQDVGEIPRLVNMLLMLLDEYSAPGLLVATTNLHQSLDQAIFRRFDDAFELPLPSKTQIKQLILMTLSAFQLSKEINWPRILEKLDGNSCSIVVSIAMNAAKASVLDELPSISETIIDASIDSARIAK
ncbi:MAG TPA: ATP-binding protein [Candidatus Kapabacteria bacterium]|nr:ATP-binding protein [Candidatus Kapabacteria bacterium]